MTPDFRSLLLLAKTVEHRSLSKAAGQVHIVISAASRRISQLEEQFGVLLLTRLLGGGVEPTAAGRSLAAHVSLLMQAINTMNADMSDFSKGAKGHIRLQANVSAMSQRLPEQLTKFSREFPEIKLDIKEARSHEVIKAVREGSADVGVIVDGNEARDLERREYQQERLCIVLPADHPMRDEPVAFEDLLDQDFVGFDGNAAITRTMAAVAEERGVPLRLRVCVSSYDAACRMIEAGYGIGVLPEGVARAYARSPRLRIAALSNAWALRQMVVCTRPTDVSAPARALFAALSGNHR